MGYAGSQCVNNNALIRSLASRISHHFIFVIIADISCVLFLSVLGSWKLTIARLRRSGSEHSWLLMLMLLMMVMLPPPLRRCRPASCISFPSLLSPCLYRPVNFNLWPHTLARKSIIAEAQHGQAAQRLLFRAVRSCGAPRWRVVPAPC